MSIPYDHEGEDEDWLRDYKAFARSAPGPARQPPQPIFVGKIKRACPHCTFEAAVELFRDGKCLACQAADFIGPIKKISPA